MSQLYGKDGTSDSSDDVGLQRLFTVDEVADSLRLSSRTIRRLIADKKLAVVRIGRVVRVRAEAVAALLNGQEMTGADNNDQG